MEALRPLAFASAMSCSMVALPRSHIGATRIRNGRAPPASISRAVRSRAPQGSSSAISSAECAPVLPVSARCSIEPVIAADASLPIMSGAR